MADYFPQALPRPSIRRFFDDDDQPEFLQKDKIPTGNENIPADLTRGLPLSTGGFPVALQNTFRDTRIPTGNENIPADMNRGSPEYSPVIQDMTRGVPLISNGIPSISSGKQEEETAQKRAVNVTPAAAKASDVPPPFASGLDKTPMPSISKPLVTDSAIGNLPPVGTAARAAEAVAPKMDDDAGLARWKAISSTEPNRINPAAIQASIDKLTALQPTPMAPTAKPMPSGFASPVSATPEMPVMDTRGLGPSTLPTRSQTAIEPVAAVEPPAKPGLTPEMQAELAKWKARQSGASVQPGTPMEAATKMKSLLSSLAPAAEAQPASPVVPTSERMPRREMDRGQIETGPAKTLEMWSGEVKDLPGYRQFELSQQNAEELMRRYGMTPMDIELARKERERQYNQSVASARAARDAAYNAKLTQTADMINKLGNQSYKIGRIEIQVPKYELNEDYVAKVPSDMFDVRQAIVPVNAAAWVRAHGLGGVGGEKQSVLMAEGKPLVGPQIDAEFFARAQPGASNGFEQYGIKIPTGKKLSRADMRNYLAALSNRIGGGGAITAPTATKKLEQETVLTGIDTRSGTAKEVEGIKEAREREKAKAEQAERDRKREDALAKEKRELARQAIANRYEALKAQPIFVNGIAVARTPKGFMVGRKGDRLPRTEAEQQAVKAAAAQFNAQAAALNAELSALGQ